MTQKEIILRVLEQDGGFVPGSKLEKQNTDYGFIGTSGLRRCRELENEGKIESKQVGRFVQYRIKSEPVQQVLIPLSRVYSD